MDIKQIKKEFGLKNDDLAALFGLSPESYAASTAKERYENALVQFYMIIKEKIKPPTLDERLEASLSKMEEMQKEIMERAHKRQQILLERNMNFLKRMNDKYS